MFVVDASVWVARFVRHDAHHLPSRSWLGRLVEQGVLIALPGITLPEIAGPVARQTNSTNLGLQAAAIVQELPTVRLVPVDHALADLAARSAAELRLRGMDAIYVALARYLELPLVTWDRELLRRAAAVVTSLTPSDAD